MALREVLAKFDIDVNAGPLQRAGGLVRGFQSQLVTLGGVLAGAAIVRGAQRFVTDMIQVGDELHKAGLQVGLATEQLQAWRFAAERSGVSGQELTQSLMRLQRGAFEAADGVKTYTESFAALGITVKDGEGNLKDANTLMMEMARGFGGLESQTEKVALAQRLMGRSGAKLLPMFEDGAEGAQELLERFRELGGGFSEEFVERGAAAQDALTDFNTAMEGVKSTITVAILPALTRFVMQAAELGASFSQLTKNSHLVEIAFAAIGAAALSAAIKTVIAFAPAIAVFLFIAAAIAAVLLLIDDFIVFLEGGKSTVGEFFDAIGIGQANAREGILGLAEDFRKFFAAIPALGAEFLEFWGGIFMDLGGLFSGFADTIIDFWVNEFPRAVGSAIDSITDFIGVDRIGATSSGAVAGSTAGGGGSVDARTSVNVDVSGAGNPVAVATAVSVQVGRVLDERNRRAAMALEQAGA